MLDDFAEPTADQITDRRIGTVVGRYRLSAVLGRGGAGTVYLAERADDEYSARVAIKVLAQGAHNLGMRFKLERQILASLNHPNIARLIDAGQTEDGQPYLVMEYVEGVAVHRYSDEQQLEIHERLKLFNEICGAVQYAHQNLVVHRDLKPQNVLVTADGKVKLLDFGIAKLLEAGSHTTEALTRMHERVLTVEYASPEQVRGDPITTATDVYSLGVVLYQLLTGVLPFPVTPNASQVELERLVCLTDPPRPSVAVLKAFEADPENQLAIAAARNLTVERLSRRLVGDIDAIVLRALRKEAEHRYPSVEQLSTDLLRHLQNEPVQARQGNWVYYSQRFMRRHTATVAVGTTFVLGLIGVAVAMSVQAHRIAIERDNAEAVSEFMTDSFGASDPFVHQGKEMTAGELLDAAAKRIGSDLKKAPEVRVRLLEAIGRSFMRQGLSARAIPHLEQAAAIQRTLGRKDAMAATIATELAISYREAGRFSDSERAFAEGLAISDSLKDENSKYRARLLADLARLEIWRSNPKKAQEQLTAALAITRRIDGRRSLDAAAILSSLAGTYLWSDDIVGAERLSREAVSIYHSAAPELYPDRVNADSSLGEVLLIQGRAVEAAAIFTTVLDARRRLYSEKSLRFADSLVSMAEAMQAQARSAEAEKFLRQAISIFRDGNESDRNKLIYPQTTLGRILLERGAAAEAELELRAAFELSEKVFGKDHQYTAAAAHYLGEVLLTLGKLKEAESVLKSAIDGWRRSGAAAWRAARSESSLAEVHYRCGRTAEAKQLFASSLRVLEGDSKADQRAVAKARQRLKQFYPEYLERKPPG